MRDLKFNAETPLYTSGPENTAVPWRMDQAQKALASLYDRNKPVVVFVHGRGEEPNKSFRGARVAEGLAVWKLELGYNCAVLMFNWDSDFPGFSWTDRTRPMRNSIEGSKRFSEFLSQLVEFEAEHPTFAKPTLLAHSMGNFVLQNAIRKDTWPNTNHLFKQVILSQPDVDDVGHSQWLTSLGQKERVFSTFNNDDAILQKSTDDRAAGAHALGLGTTQPLAQNIKYIDLTHMGKLGGLDDDHEVFGKKAMNGQVNVCVFFEQALLGKDVTLDDSNVESVSQKVIFKLKTLSDRSAPCLQIPTLPNFKKNTAPTEP